MALFAFLPEIAAFLMLLFMGTQLQETGPILVLMQFAILGGLFALRPVAFFETVLRWWPLLLTPILAVLSTLWSDATMATLRYSVQYLFTALAGVHLARLMSPQRFVTVLFLALFTFCILCILHGRQGESAEGPVLIGLTGSKNQMGFAAQLLILTAISVLLIGTRSAPLRTTALLALPLGLFLVLGVHSATALLMALGGAGALVALWVSQRMTPGARLATLVAVFIVLTPLLMLLPEINKLTNDFIFDTLGKDPTLTGRTYLWQRADALVAQKPLLGWGYQAIWMGDGTETIALKRLTGINDGRVFHFHHQFRQIAVDTGMVGLVVFSVLYATVMLASLRRMLLKPDPASAFIFILLALTLARAFTDTVLVPFNIHSMLFFVACVYALKPDREVTPAVSFLRPARVAAPA